MWNANKPLLLLLLLLLLSSSLSLLSLLLLLLTKKNKPFALQHPKVVDEYLANEVSL